VKHHDRVGRMADTLEYSNVAFPRHRFTDDLVDELKHFAPSLVEEDGEQLIIKHLYIERRMVPLNIWLGTPKRKTTKSSWNMASSNTATPSRNWWPPTSSRRYAVQELRRHASPARGVLRLR
jgi:hypothetical protein